jgi:hypothetical protein
MAESAALLVDEVLPEQPIRQWVLGFPFQLRFFRRFAPHFSGQLKLFNASLLPVRQPSATDGAGTGDCVPGHIIMLFLDGVYTETKHGRTRFLRTNGPEQQELIELVHTISQRVAGFL